MSIPFRFPIMDNDRQLLKTGPIRSADATSGTLTYRPSGRAASVVASYVVFSRHYAPGSPADDIGVESLRDLRLFISR